MGTPSLPCSPKTDPSLAAGDSHRKSNSAILRCGLRPWVAADRLSEIAARWHTRPYRHRWRTSTAVHPGPCETHFLGSVRTPRPRHHPADSTVVHRPEGHESREALPSLPFALVLAKDHLD